MVKVIEVDGHVLEYEVGGEGSPCIVLLSGERVPIQFWDKARALMEGIGTVLTYNRPGVGKSSKPTSQQSADVVSSTLHQLLDKLDLEPPFLLVGHSSGGLPVARIAIDHPEMVMTLTLFDSSTLVPGDLQSSAPDIRPAGPPPTRDSIRQGLLSSRNSIRKDFVTDEYVEAQLEVASHPKIRQAAERLEALRKRFVEQNSEKIQARPALAHNSGTGWWLYEVKDEALDMLRAGRLQTPTLIVWGFNDPSAPYDMGVDLFQLISKSVDRVQLHFFNQSGHSPYREYPREITDLMGGFINNVKD